MGSVNVFTAARMQEIEDTTVVSGLVDVNGDLILTTRVGTPINAGLVKGTDGVPGAVGPAGPAGPAGADSLSTTFQLGAIFAWAADIIPIGHLELNGQTIVGGASTYSGLAALFPSWVSGANLVLPNWGEQVPVGKKTRVSLGTFTVTIASPGVITKNAHGLADGQRVEFTTTGALPTGLVSGVRYFVRDSTLNTFRVASTLGGSAINTSGSQSGVHTLWDSDFTVIGESVGAKTHQLSTSELASHTHTQQTKNAGTVNASEVGKGDSSSGTGAVGSGINATGGDRPHNNVQPSRVVKWIVCAATSSGEFDTSVQASLVSNVNKLLQRVSGSVKRANTTRTFVQNAWYLLDTLADWAVDLAVEGGLSSFDGKWTIPEDGLYQIDATISIGASINLLLMVKANNAAASSAGGILVNSGVGTAGFTGVSVAGERALTQGDVLRIAIFPNTYAGPATWYPSSTLDARIAGFFGLRKVADL